MTASTLVTGVAGFIGYHVAARMLSEGQPVVGLDNLNRYYSAQLKHDRLALLRQQGLQFFDLDLKDRDALHKLLERGRFERVIHLAAQAGVRYSLEDPYVYADSNLTGFLNVLEGCRASGVRHLIFASSSSVYGANRTLPFSTRRPADHPLSLYGATKKANELMAHAYAAGFGLPVTGLRFFTVYGPWGRPDMALFRFASAMMRDEPIQLYNHGDLSRDFTYIDDIVEGVLRVSQQPAQPDPNWQGSEPDPSSSFAPYRIYNLGAHRPVELKYFVELVELALGKPARIEYLPMQFGDVPATFADTEDIRQAVGFEPRTSIEEGVRRSLEWFLDYRQRNPDL